MFRKASDAAVQLLLTVKLTTVSIRARAIFYSTYCLSKFTYVASYAIVTPQDIHVMQVQVAKAVLRRHWIQAQHLPGVLGVLKIAPMQDIEIAFARAAVGLLERRAREDLALRAFIRDPTLEYQGDPQFDTAVEYLVRYLPTLTPQSSNVCDTCPLSTHLTSEQFRALIEEQLNSIAMRYEPLGSSSITSMR